MRAILLAAVALCVAPVASASCLTQAEYYAAQAETSGGSVRAAAAELSQAYTMLHQAGSKCDAAVPNLDPHKAQSNPTPSLALPLSIIALAAVAAVVRRRAKEE